MALALGTLTRVDPAPMNEDDELSAELKRWLMQLTDTLNSTIEQIEKLL